MANVTFEFDMEEDRDLLRLYLKSDEMYFALDEIYNLVRTELKHGDEKVSDKIERLLDQIKEEASIIHDM